MSTVRSSCSRAFNWSKFGLVDVADDRVAGSNQRLCATFAMVSLSGRVVLPTRTSPPLGWVNPTSTTMLSRLAGVLRLSFGNSINTDPGHSLPPAVLLDVAGSPPKGHVTAAGAAPPLPIRMVHVHLICSPPVASSRSSPIGRTSRNLMVRPYTSVQQRQAPAIHTPAFSCSSLCAPARTVAPVAVHAMARLDFTIIHVRREPDPRAQVDARSYP